MPTNNENTYPTPYLQDIVSTTKDGLYMPALAGELPTGKELDYYASCYVADMRRDGGDALAACHVAI